jgi:hypothetical protein
MNSKRQPFLSCCYTRVGIPKQNKKQKSSFLSSWVR